MGNSFKAHQNMRISTVHGNTLCLTDIPQREDAKKTKNEEKSQFKQLIARLEGESEVYPSYAYSTRPPNKSSIFKAGGVSNSLGSGLFLPGNNEVAVGRPAG